MKATLHYILRLDKPCADGSAMINLLITFNKKKKLKFSLNRSIPLRSQYRHLTPEKILSYPMKKDSVKTVTRDELYYWDVAKERAVRGFGSMESLNQFLSDQAVKAQDIINDFAKRNKPLTRQSFSRAFFKKCVSTTFFEYCDNQLNVVLKNSLSAETRKSYTTIIQKLDRFRPGVRMEDIDFKFLTSYVDWMRAPKEEKGCDNDERTISNNLKVVRTMIRLAIKNEDFPVEYYPFQNFQIGNTETELTSRDFLEPEEILRLEGLLRTYVPPSKPVFQVTKAEWKERLEKGMLNPGEYQTLRYFLFACYTGLRFKDVFGLDMKEHVKQKWVSNPLTKQRKLRYYIDIQAMHKTEKPLIVPLIDKAYSLLEIGKEGRAFDVISNQKTNKHLKYIAKLAGIDKKLTFHVARHSFATTCFTYGIPDRVGQELLGHKSEKFIKVYAHLTQNHLFLEMDKVNEGYNEYEQLLRVVHRKVQTPVATMETVAQKMENEAFREVMELLTKMDKSKLEKAHALLKVVA